MIGWRTCSYVNGRILVPNGLASRIRVRRRIVSIDEPPQRGDQVIDLEGRTMLPGLVNAHDHLELNHYGQLKVRDRYDNARHWIDDLRPVIRHDPEIRRRSGVRLADRLLVGALKNILAGVTTVAHHNPLYGEFGYDYPLRLARPLGWAHSLGMEDRPVGAHGEPGGVVADRYATTSPTAPFIVHAAEGTDREAASECDELQARNVLRENTVLVHGLAIRPERWHRLFKAGVSLISCPSSNEFLFGRTLALDTLVAAPEAAGRIALGSDSRVTGVRDLLDELRVARKARVDATTLFRMVTSWAARILRLDDAGEIRVGALADLIVLPASSLPPEEQLLRCSRADISLVLRRGTPVHGEPALAPAFVARRVHTVPIVLDGYPRLLQAALARRLERMAIAEDGVELVHARA